MNTNRSCHGWLLVGSIALFLACSESGLARHPSVPVPGAQPPEEPALIDLLAPPDPAFAGSGFCGTIGFGSSGIRRIRSLGGDGSFAVAHGSGRIVLQDIDRPAAVRTLVAHAGPISNLSVSSDRKLMLTADESGEVKLWRLYDGKLLRVVQKSGPLAAAALSPDGSLVALGRGSTLMVQQALDGTRLWDKYVEYDPVTLTFSADSQTLLSGLDTVMFHRASDGAWIRNLGLTALWAPAFSPDLSRALTFRSGTLALRDLITGAELWQTGGVLGVELATFSDDGGLVAFANRRDGVKVLDAANGSLVRAWPFSDGDGSAIAFSADRSRVALGLKQGGFRVWDIATGELLVKEIAQPGHLDAVTELAFSPDGSLIGSMTSALPSTDRSLKVWRPSDAALLYTTSGATEATHRSFAFSPDSRTIALGNGGLTLLDALDGSLRGTIKNADATGLAFSPDGAWLVGGPDCIGCNPEALSVWRVADGQPQPGFGGVTVQEAHAVTFSADGSLIAATAKGFLPPDLGRGTLSGTALVAVWRVADRRLLWSRPAVLQEGARAAFSPDGTQLAVTSTQADLVRIHRSQNGELLRELPVSAEAVAFSPSGELATAGDAGVRLWRITDGKPIAEAAGTFTAVAFAPDGQRLIAASRDGSLRLLCRSGRPMP